MTRDEMVDLFGLDEQTLFMDGFDDCIVGVCEQFGRPTVVAYDINAVLTNLQSQGMTEEEAIEWFYYNQHGAWMGEYTPAFIRVV